MLDLLNKQTDVYLIPDLQGRMLGYSTVKITCELFGRVLFDYK
jgi:hypothetical protein